MTWFLLLVWIERGEPKVHKIEEYESMYDCFYGFEFYEDKLPPDGNQLICVKEKENG